jgi:ubiquinone/menaquinone biosynthesis C-methylase UbiE
MEHTPTTLDWFERSYAAEGVNAQRRYPNEELIRFMARNFFMLPRDERARVSILDVGCGSCSNLWMIAREGFEAHGVDLSPEGLRLGGLVLAEWGVRAQLKKGSLLSLPYEDQYFDAVVDIVVSYVLNLAEFQQYLLQVGRVLKTGGKFFLFTPSTGSDAFKNYAPAKKVDEFTLNGIYRKDSPLYGNFYPFRFSDAKYLQQMITTAGLESEGMELHTRTYGCMSEQFQFLSLEARRVR